MPEFLLKIEDQATYFPDVTLSSGQLLGAIASSIAKAEGPLGANRSLEITEYTESPFMDGNRLFLSYWPLVLNPDGTPDLTIEARTGAGSDTFGRGPFYSSPETTAYRSVDPSLYEVDAKAGEILFSTQAGLSFINAYSAIGVGGRHHLNYVSLDVSPEEEWRHLQSQVRVTYKAGFNFDLPDDQLSRDALLIKSLVANILTSEDAGLKSFVKKEIITDFHTLEYSASGATMIATQAMQALQRYKPNNFA